MTFCDARGRRMTAIMPHPDDESYSAAGTLALAATSGAQVSLLCATRGEGGWIHGKRGVSPERVAALRATELGCSCAALGLPAPRFLGWPDGGIETIDEERRLQELSAAVDELNPDVIITLAGDGVYGHRDHVALTRTCQALDSSRRLLLATFPGGLFTGFARRFQSLAPELLVPDLDPSALGVDPDAVDLCVEIGDVAEQKLASITCHTSQLTQQTPAEFLFPGLIEAVSEREWFTLASGPPLTGTSPFSGLP